MKNTLKTLFTLFFLGLLMACGPVEDDSTSKNNNIEITNNEADLAEFITIKDEVVVVDEVTGTTNNSSNKPGLQKSSKLPPETQLTLIAEVDPPTYGDVTLQATEVHINGSRAYVSYNVQGSQFHGAVDIIKINDADDPELASRVIFTDSDIHAIERVGNTLYLASATDSGDYSSPAILKIVKLDNSFLIDSDATINTIDLPSYAATDVDVLGNIIYVSSGASGGAITMLDKNDLTTISVIDVEDPRGISSWRGAGLNGVSIITGGDNARLIFIDEDEPSITASELAISGATIEEAKATVERNKNITLLAAGEGGMQVVCNDNNTLEGFLEPPTGVLDSEDNVLDSERTVTNAASASGRFAYMANGEAGVYMAMIDGKFNGNSCDMTGLEIVGKLRLGDKISANHVTAKNDLLFVASGLGGLKILKIEDSSIEHEDEDDESDDDESDDDDND